MAPLLEFGLVRAESILVLSGIIGHIIFNRLEPRSRVAALSLLLGPPAALAVLFRSSYKSIFLALLASYIYYLGTLISSVVTYRLSPFHPLAGYPGPIVAKITRLWAMYIVLTGDQHRYHKRLHSRYGTHVRTGPNHISICDSAAIQTIYGAKGFPKGDRYGIGLPPGPASLLSLKDPHEHAQRRRLWDRGLSMEAIHGYIETLSHRIAQLASALGKQPGEVDLSMWLSFVSFDFMGDLGFGGAFTLMEEGSDPTNWTRLMVHSNKFQETAGAASSLMNFLFLIPGGKGIESAVQFAKNSVITRKARGSATKDIFYYLLDEEGLGSMSLSLPALIVESLLIIGAGSDTTGTAMSNLFFYLISNPAAFVRLQSEVDEAFPSGSDVCVPEIVREMTFLNAVINEALRLQPAVPNGVQRFIPSGRGTIIAGRWVPASTTVQVPTYSLHRNPRYFSPKPDSFLPERWLKSHQEKFITDQSAFIPFSYGPRNCVGKNLALQELRMVTCALIQKFEFKFAPGWDSKEWERNLTDNFIMAKEKLPVLVKLRT